MTKRPTRLELHRLRYHAANGKSALLSMNELSEDERQLISLDFFSHSHGGRLLFDRDAVLSEVLSSWGVMCTHPWDGMNGRLCAVCGAWVIHRTDIPEQKKVTGNRR